MQLLKFKWFLSCNKVGKNRRRIKMKMTHYFILKLQCCGIEMQHLLHKPHVNEVNLNGQNLYLKSCQTSELKLCMLRRLRSFHRGTVGLCRSTGFKVKSCQSWRFDKKYCPRPQSNHTSAARIRFRKIGSSSNFDSL